MNYCQLLRMRLSHYCGFAASAPNSRGDAQSIDELYRSQWNGSTPQRHKPRSRPWRFGHAAFGSGRIGRRGRPSAR